jgi:hypothetical protein
LTDLPAKEQVKNDLTAAAAKLVKQAVMSAGPTPASSAATGATTVKTSSQSCPATSAGRIPAHDEEGNLLPGFLNKARIDKVSSTVTD